MEDNIHRTRAGDLSNFRKRGTDVSEHDLQGGETPHTNISSTFLRGSAYYTPMNNTDANRTRTGNESGAHVGVGNLLDVFNEVDEHIMIDDNTNEVEYVADLWEGYMSLGPPSKVCAECHSVMWNQERNNKSNMNARPTFMLCCKNGSVVLPPEDFAPEPLRSLLSTSEKATHFKQNIRVYNSMFAMCSSGGKVDHKINNGRAPYCFKIRGTNMHFIGSLLPPDGQHPKFCQLYIYDTENEEANRLNAVGQSEDQIDLDIVRELTKMFDQHNKLVRYFRTARERFKNQTIDEFKLILISSRAQNGRPNVIGPSNEIAGLIVNPNADTTAVRDTIVETRHQGLKRVYETDAYFMQLQFPILFPLGTDGYHREIRLAKSRPYSAQPREHDEEQGFEKRQRDFVTLKEYYSSKLMIRPNEGLTPHLGGRLWQQYVVDAFTAMEQYRLDWISRNQTTIRSDLYNSVRDAVRRGDNDPNQVGKCVVLPASFTGSKRYMSQYFKDSLALCRAIGHPTLFLTMTTNSKWPEITEMMKHLPGVNVCDAPDVVARVFKMKLDQLIDLIKKKHFFGKCIGLMHVIEFQKRGLPHAHMLIWLHPKDKPNSVEEIDRLVSAEIPDPSTDKIGYAAVKNYMIHGPCGKDHSYSACMVNNKCSRHFPKKYNGITCFDECGFPIYRRRDTGRTVLRKGSVLDNRYVVPFNRELLVKFQCHINVEICNSSRSLKYLFKYCLKGHDNATMLLKKSNASMISNKDSTKVKVLDEVNHYVDGRYVCASEAAWRILGFDIHSRWPSVDRLPIHMPGNKHVSFKTGESLESVCARADTKRSKLEAWFIANNDMPAARNYTYAEFPSFFTWIPKECKWKQRQRGEVVGRLSEVHATAGELLYLRMLLMRQKGATSFEEVRTFEGVRYNTFKEACSAMGLLQSDNQWHDALAENSHSHMPNQLREMFVNILCYCSISDPLLLWNTHWRILSDDVLMRRRKITLNNELSLSDDEIQNFALAG
ncbi:uncharacterized protein LOC108198216 [Daucus carota subsp. sativus]|uniref:uncharacterized protein LOC108198216 n=1 Tax=Daucus carota subsp. sativus TaxID=79200 RepID=UPI003082CC32